MTREEYKRDYQNRWIKSRREQWIAEQGGKCVQCGSTFDLEVDHIDPSTKVTHRLWSLSKPRRDAELAKCQVLCSVCHKEKSDAAMVVHGSRSRYESGCRCTVCRESMKVIRKGRRTRATMRNLHADVC